MSGVNDRRKIIIRRGIGEERMEFYVGGDCIGQANHDAHGWAGMELAESLIEALAKALDIEVIHEDGG